MFLCLFSLRVFKVIDYTRKMIDSSFLDAHDLSCRLINVSTAWHHWNIYWTWWIYWTWRVHWIQEVQKEKREWIIVFQHFRIFDWSVLKVFWNCFTCNLHLRQEHLQSSWLSLQFMHYFLFIDAAHFSMWCLFMHLKQRVLFLQNLIT